jgi:uncharacterized protein YndB with AHSA1/START domain
MSLFVRCVIGLILLGVLFASGAGLMQAGLYGLSVFIVHPFALGALTCWVFRPARSRAAGWYGSFAVLFAALSLLPLRMEGAICIAISLPLTLPLGAMGGWYAHRAITDTTAARGGLAMLILIPAATLTYDTHARPPVYAVKTTTEIAASPDRVWQALTNLSQLPAPHEWYFRTGLAYPTGASIGGSGRGAIRYCEFSTGPVVEVIELWEAPHVLRFRVTEMPAPMREWNPFGEISPKHLHGYLISREGEFRLTPLPGNRTLLEGTSWYQHGLEPAQYWRLWTDAVFHRIHLRVFRQIRALAERS